MPHTVLIHVYQAALWTWENIDADAEFKRSYTKNFQGFSVPYAEFVGKLTDEIQRHVTCEETPQYLLRQLGFKNANGDCQAILLPIRERKDVMGYLKACGKVDSIKHQIHVNDTEAYAVKKQAQESAISAKNTEPLPNLPFQQYHRDLF